MPGDAYHSAGVRVMPQREKPSEAPVVTHIMADGTVRDSLAGVVPPKGLPPVTRRVIADMLRGIGEQTNRREDETAPCHDRGESVARLRSGRDRGKLE